MNARLLAGAAVLLALSVARAADPASAPAPGETVSAARELDAIRDLLVALDIEKALAAVDAVLERSDLAEETRVEVLDLRAQAHAASDDLDAAEKDYRAILELKAGYTPNREVTSRKAMDRFAKIRAAMIGTVHVDVDPKDAVLTVDDRPVAVSPEGSFAAVAGERRLRFTRKGFDTLDATVHAVAREDTLLKIRMVPNARGLVVRTDVDGVAVTLDGVASGLTARAAGDGSGAGAPASLLIEDVAIGEHEIGLTKSCFATENIQEIVSVDLADRSPKLTRLVAMRPSRTRVTATGASYEGELRVDGERAAALPLTSFSMCPGTRTIQVIASGRVVWNGTLTAEESDVTLDLMPRPNAVLVGPEWPKSWETATVGWSLRDRIAPPAGADLTTIEGWSRVTLPPASDLAVGVIPSGGVAGDERVVLYSPVLREVDDRAAKPPASRPSWVGATLGAVLVDRDAEGVVVASVDRQGPAAKSGLLPGDRIVAIGGRAVTNAASARDAVARSGAGASLILDIAPPALDSRKIECVTAAEPLIAPPPGDDAGHVVRAAWASVDSAAGGADAPLALANLALLLERAGRPAAALDAWRRVRSTGAGGLAARAAYALGAGLQTEGKRAEAIEAFHQAETEGSRCGDAALAAAAIDRLADLGVAPR